jgi:hypothetical protein
VKKEIPQLPVVKKEIPQLPVVKKDIGQIPSIGKSEKAAIFRKDYTKPVVETPSLITKKVENEKPVEKLPSVSDLEAMKKLIDEKTLLLSQSILKQVPSQDLLFENYASFDFSFSSFRSKTRNYMLTHFPPYISRTYSKDVQMISKNSRIIDFRDKHLVKIEQATILINGTSVYLKEHLNASLSFKFIRSNGLKHNVYQFTTPKIKILNKDGNFSEQILTNIDAYLPLSDKNIFTYIPVLQIHKENNNEGDFELTVKVVLRTSKVAVDTVDTKSLNYLNTDVSSS